MDQKTPAGDASDEAARSRRASRSTCWRCALRWRCSAAASARALRFSSSRSRRVSAGTAPQVVSVYSLTWLAGGLTAPLVGRLFDRSGPRIVYSLGLLLLGGAFLVASRAQALWQFQLEHRAVRRDRHRPDRQRAEFDPARPLVRPAAADRDGGGLFRDRRRRPGAAAGVAGADRPYRLARRLPDCSASSRCACWCRCCCCRGGCSPPARRMSRRKADADFVDDGWTLLSAMRHHAFWALFSTFFFTAVGDVRDHGADRRLSDRCRISAAAGGDRLGLFRRGAAVRHARRHRTLDGIIGRRPSVLFSYAHLDRRHHPALAAAILSELLAADRLSSSASAA